MPDYFMDTSALVKNYVDEPGCHVVRDLLANHRRGRVYVAAITFVETVAALCARERRADITLPKRADLVVSLREDFAVFTTCVVVTQDLLDEAAGLASRQVLRGYDAVQLAGALVVQRVRAEEGGSRVILVSADAQLNVAAEAEGLEVLDPTDK